MLKSLKAFCVLSVLIPGLVMAAVPMRGVMSNTTYSAADMNALGINGYKANLIRWQITRNWGIPDAELNLADWNAWFAGKLNELDQVLVSAQANGLKVVIDMHTPPGGRASDNSMYMFYQSVYRDRFISAWQEMATRYNSNPAVWAYDLINEPVEKYPLSTPPGFDPRSTQIAAANAVRAIDPNTPIIFEAFGGHPDGYDGGFWTFAPVTTISNAWYSSHLYAFSEVTGFGTPTPQDCYPGVIRGTLVDKNYLRNHMDHARQWSLAHGTKMYIGEFSIPVGACGATQYLTDTIDILEEYGWDWSYHAFRENPMWSMEAPDRKPLFLSWFAQNINPYAVADTQPPNAITDLACTSPTVNSATLSWHAPSDPPSGGPATTYLIYYTTNPAGPWIDATGEPTPAAPGTLQTYNLGGLAASTHYFTTMKSVDATGYQASANSNVAEFTTLSVPTQSPYGGTSRSIPGTIQSEDYDNGGEGIAYHDTDTVNSLGAYRTDGVDIKNSSDSPTSPAVGWVAAAGEWQEYTVNVATTGSHTLRARVASANSNKSFRVEFDGVTKATINVPNTGPWDTAWATVTKTGVQLTAGTHIMRVYAITNNFDVNYISFTKP